MHPVTIAYWAVLAGTVAFALTAYLKTRRQLRVWQAEIAAFRAAGEAALAEAEAARDRAAAKLLADVANLRDLTNQGSTR